MRTCATIERRSGGDIQISFGLSDVTSKSKSKTKRVIILPRYLCLDWQGYLEVRPAAAAAAAASRQGESP
jgi:hypothetical protein